MEENRLGVIETRFAQLIWDNEPIASGELVKLCKNELQWKKSTTYTVLKRLCAKGFFKNENKVITSLISKEDYFSTQSHLFVEESFGGSLPSFIAAFVKQNEISTQEIEEIQKIIDSIGRK